MADETAIANACDAGGAIQTKEDWHIINGDEGYDYETVLEYAEQYCWGNLNADEQRCMADCPVVEYFATTCMICRCE